MTRCKWSGRAALVARLFGVSLRDVRSSRRRHLTPAISLERGKLILIAGASGSGKSTLLRALRRGRGRQRRCHWIDLGKIRLVDRPVIDLIVDALGSREEAAAIVEGLELLSRVGLSEVWTYLRRPRELSEGQRWRLRLALALGRAQAVRDPGSELPGLSGE